MQAAVQLAVADPVGQLLGDTALWSALDGVAWSVVSGLIGDPVVLETLYDAVSAAVGAPGGFGCGGGPQVATAVVSLVTNPDVAWRCMGWLTRCSPISWGPWVVPAISGLLVRWRWRCSPGPSRRRRWMRR